MQFLVGKIRPDVIRNISGTEHEVERKAWVKSYHTSHVSAVEAAEYAAGNEPGAQFAVFGILEIVESLPPVAPKLIHKKINENGEIVVQT